MTTTVCNHFDGEGQIADCGCEPITMSDQAYAALNAVLDLRELTHDTHTVTRRSQNIVLQKLVDADMIAVSKALAQDKQQFGW